jgi:hypothetical protein
MLEFLSFSLATDEAGPLQGKVVQRLHARASRAT